jgi:hypothetical protein
MLRLFRLVSRTHISMTPFFFFEHFVEQVVFRSEFVEQVAQPAMDLLLVDKIFEHVDFESGGDRPR